MEGLVTQGNKHKSTNCQPLKKEKAKQQTNFGGIPLHALRIRQFSFSVSVPKAKGITYAQIPFYLSNLSDTEDILKIVLEIRAICDEFSSRGLPNYPSGIPFTFWEQYIKLRFYLMLALLCILVVTFLVLTIVLMNPWLATIIVS